jgi:hypothetical protein
MRLRDMTGTLILWASEAHGAIAFDLEGDGTPECDALAKDEVSMSQLETLQRRNYKAVRALLMWLDQRATE